MQKRDFSNFNVLLKLIIIVKIERYRTLMALLLLNEKTLVIIVPAVSSE